MYTEQEQQGESSTTVSSLKKTLKVINTLLYYSIKAQFHGFNLKGEIETLDSKDLKLY